MTDKIAEILNLNPPCSQEHKEKAIECISTFARKAKFILDIKVNDKNN